MTQKLRVRWSHRRQDWKAGRNFFLRACPACGGPALRVNFGHRVHCTKCDGGNKGVMREKFTSPFHRAVGKAVRDGALPHPTTLACVDCGEPAACYDHRDYSKPLEVHPVCRGCNARRGPAIQLDHLVRMRSA